MSVSGTMTLDGDVVAAVRTASGEVTLRAVVVAADDRLTLFVNGAARALVARAARARGGGFEGREPAGALLADRAASLTGRREAAA